MMCYTQLYCYCVHTDLSTLKMSTYTVNVYTVCYTLCMYKSELAQCYAMLRNVTQCYAMLHQLQEHKGTMERLLRLNSYSEPNQGTV